MSGKRALHLLVVLTMALSVVYVGSSAAPASVDPAQAEHDRIVAFWTPERVAQAIPRDFVIDEHGAAFLRGADGILYPYGQGVSPVAPILRAIPLPFAKGGPVGSGGSDGTPPDISIIAPLAGANITATQTFSATVTDASGVKSVTVVIMNDSSTWNFAASKGTNDVWSTTIQGFTAGSWSWQVIAKDNAKRGGNTATSEVVSFTCCDTSGGGGGGGTDVIADAPWRGGAVQNASGRLLFQMPSNPKKTRWTSYVCSGSVATDGTGSRSVIITAAHCVYDDAYKEFARNVMFIPDQVETNGSGTDWNCGNDPLGCWTAKFGLVDTNYAARTFPDNNAWDYGFYVVDDSGAWTTGYRYGGTGVLDSDAGSLDVSFVLPGVGLQTHAFGYSYSQDPDLRYCAQGLGEFSDVNWFLSSCGMTGGSSGGPWMQSAGEGPIISVNSWGYTNQPGMAGPKLNGTSAACVFGKAKSETTSSTGIAVTC